MRVPTGRLWRAFPELDPFTDEQCRRFMRLACRRSRWRHIHRLILLSSFLVMLGVASIGVAVVFLRPIGPGSSGDRAFDEMGWLMRSGVVASAALMVLLVPLLLRDRLLRLRLRSVLRGTGVCSQCGHSLVGLSVPDSLEVTCPECGFLCRVDLSLSELALDGDGRSVGRRIVFQRAPFWTAERRRRWVKGTVIAAVILVVTIGGPLMIFEWRVRTHAARAAAMVPTLEDMRAIIRTHRPGLELKPVPAAYSAMDLLTNWSSDLISAEDAPRHRPGATVVDLDFTVILPELPLEAVVGGDPEALKHGLLKARYMEELLRRMAANGLDRYVDGIVSAPVEVQDHGVAPLDASTTILLTHLGRSRGLARMLAACARLAVHDGDTPTAERFLAALLALAKTVEAQGFIIDRLVSIAIRSLAMETMKRWLASDPAAAELDAIERLLHLARPSFDFRLALECETLMARAMVADFFSDATTLRLALFVPDEWLTERARWGSSVSAIGTLDSNLDAIERLRTYALKAMALAPWERNARLGPAPVPPADAAIAALIYPVTLSSWLNAEDFARTTLHSLQIMWAIERWRLDHGDVPESLDQLVPSILPELPVDPATGGPLGYRRIDPEGDRPGRRFLLWSAGPDGVDNAGLEELNEQTGAPLGRRGAFVTPGFDEVLNRSSPIPRAGGTAAGGSGDAVDGASRRGTRAGSVPADGGDDGGGTGVDGTGP